MAFEFVAAARSALPNEAVGLLVSHASYYDDGAPERYISLSNSLASPYRYAIDPDEQLRVWTDLDAADEVVWAICHSHVSSPAFPSATDIAQAYFADSLYLICSLDTLIAESPLRAWSIRDGVATEVFLAIY